MEGHTDWVWSCIELENNLLASTSLDKSIIIWNNTNGKIIKRLFGHTDAVWGIAKLIDGNIATGSKDMTYLNRFLIKIN